MILYEYHLEFETGLGVCLYLQCMYILKLNENLEYNIIFCTVCAMSTHPKNIGKPGHVEIIMKIVSLWQYFTQLKGKLFYFLGGLLNFPNNGKTQLTSVYTN